MTGELCSRGDPASRHSWTDFEGTHHLLYGEVASDGIDPRHPTSLAHLPVRAEQKGYILRRMDVFAKHGKRQFDDLARAMTTDRGKVAFLRG